MPLIYTIDVLVALKEKGFSAYRLSKENIMSNGSIQKLRRGEILGADGIATLCELLEMQPGDFIAYEKLKQGRRDYDF